MKVYKGLQLSDQKAMFENLFIWNLENGEKPDRGKYKKWILEFFQEGNIKEYINDSYDSLNSLLDSSFYKLFSTYYFHYQNTHSEG